MRTYLTIFASKGPTFTNAGGIQLVKICERRLWMATNISGIQLKEYKYSA